jgi:hypothetical protein
MRSAVILHTPMTFGSGLERDLATLGPFAVAAAGDLVVVKEAAHALPRPRIAMPGRDADAIEQARKLTVRRAPGQLTERDRIVRPAAFSRCFTWSSL